MVTKKQLAATRLVVPTLALAVAVESMSALETNLETTVKAQSQQIQHQHQKTLESATQQSHLTPKNSEKP